ncbi:MAG: malate synthase A [Deltaproteobacteria bacterium]
MKDVDLRGPLAPGYDSILTDEAIAFVADLARTFTQRVNELLERRVQAQARFDAGDTPHFLEETKSVREGDWTVAPLPADLLDRRVEITGPVDRKMIINALNSGANMFMADFEDSNAPSWSNVVEGQINLRDAVRGTIGFRDDAKGKDYALNDDVATLLVRPRGWHLVEKHMVVDGAPVPAGLFDFGLYFFHNAKALTAKGSGPYFYLPKLQSHLEARLWNDVFVRAQDKLGVAQGTIKATVLIETLPAAFEMDEILYELREHSAGLNCGRWDYIFSYIKTFRNHAERVLPDRAQVGMTQPFMAAYSQLVIKTCHKRRVHAMGGMAAQIPIKNDPEANDKALAKVRADKLREVENGHDGTWVAHPGLVGVAKAIFDEHMKTPNQLDNLREDVNVTEADLVAVPTGTRTEGGVRENVNVGVLYLEAWLRGSGCVPLYNLMEDAATAEISRTQLWQWIKHGATLEDGRTVDVALVKTILDEEMKKIEADVGAERFAHGRFAEAKAIFERLATDTTCGEFLTLPAYDVLVSGSAT